MRDIKFRAWDKKYNKMYHGDIRTALAYPDEEIEIMQFTGLLDKNGKEIYESDILAWDITSPDDMAHGCYFEEDEVIFIEGAFALKEGDNLNSYSKEWEVMGNIYEDKPIK